MSKALEIVTKFRDMAIAVLRLTKVNALAEELQIANANVKSLTSTLEDANKHIAEVSAGEFSPSYEDLKRFKTADEARAAVLEGLNKTVETVTKQLEDGKKAVTDLTAKITDVASGKKPFSRETITAMANEMIKSNAATLPSLEEIAVADESGNQDFDAKV